MAPIDEIGHSVILCGHSAEKPLAKKDVVMITAHSIYMNGFGHDMVGTAAKTFSLTSTNLAIDGELRVGSDGADYVAAEKK